METLSIQFIQADTASTAFRMAMLTTVLHKSTELKGYLEVVSCSRYCFFTFTL